MDKLSLKNCLIFITFLKGAIKGAINGTFLFLIKECGMERIPEIRGTIESLYSLVYSGNKV